MSDVSMRHLPPGDRIELRGLRVRAVCGVLPEERERYQPFEFDIDVYTDLADAAASDDLVDTVDYGTLCALVAGIADNERFELLERSEEHTSEVQSPE